MSFQFRPAVREGVGLLIGLAGASGSGKTFSALELAAGLAGDQPFALVDTEAGRALHYADQYRFDHADLAPPFTPERYGEAVKAADTAGYKVIVVDSFSHEHAGEGGLLDWHETELQRMAGDDWKKREAMTFSAWIKPKAAHKRLVSQLLQSRAHLIVCLRAEEKIEIVKEKDENGRLRTVVRPKKSLIGADGWVPICEKTLPYELTISFLLTPAAPGVPRPLKLQAQHAPFFPDGATITRAAGASLAEWASGGAKPPVDAAVVEELTERLRALADDLGAREATDEAIASHAGDAAWLRKQVAKAEAKLAELERVGAGADVDGIDF